jgi:predicted dehydrogenase
MVNHAWEPVRVGVVGLGNFGIRHASTLCGIAEAELVALVDTDAQKIVEAQQALSDVPAWDRLEDALRQSGAEAWVVATSTAAHVELTRCILGTGKPVLLEKPLASNLDDARSLAGLVHDDSSNLMLGHILLFNSELRGLVSEARQRGPLIYLNAVRHRPAWRMAPYAGESVVHLLMVHDLYVIMALAGTKDPTGFQLQQNFNEQGDVNVACAQLTWDDGLIASLTASRCCPAGMSNEGFDRLEVFGRDWAARLEPTPRPLVVWDDRARWPLDLEIIADPIAPSGMLAEELRHFCRVVHGSAQVPPGATYHDAVRLLEWMERLESSHDS